MSDTKRLIRRVSDINAAALILFYLLDVLLIRLDKYIVTALFKDSKSYADILSISAYAVQYLVVVPLCLLVFKIFDPDHEIRIKERLIKPNVSTKQLLRWIVMCFGLIYASSYLNSFFFLLVQSVSGVELQAVDFSANPTFLGVLSNIIAMTILAPFYEEFLFRGALLSNARRIGSWSAVFAVGISFGLWHGSYSQILYAAVMGTCAAFLVEKTGSLFSSLLLHICINSIGAVQSIFLGFLDFDELQKTLSENDFSYISAHKGAFMGLIIPAVIVFILMICGIVIFVKEIRHHTETFALPERHTEISVKKKVGLYFTAPIAVIAIIGSLTVTVLSAMGKI